MSCALLPGVQLHARCVCLLQAAFRWWCCCVGKEDTAEMRVWVNNGRGEDSKGMRRGSHRLNWNSSRFRARDRTSRKGRFWRSHGDLGKDIRLTQSVGQTSACLIYIAGDDAATATIEMQSCGYIGHASLFLYLAQHEAPCWHLGSSVLIKCEFSVIPHTCPRGS